MEELGWIHIRVNLDKDGSVFLSGMPRYTGSFKYNEEPHTSKQANDVLSVDVGKVYFLHFNQCKNPTTVGICTVSGQWIRFFHLPPNCDYYDISINPEKIGFLEVYFKIHAF